MTTEPEAFFLFLGSTTDSESATTRLRASGARYVKKLLNSRPDNWWQIIGLIKSPENRGTLATLTGSDYRSICSAEYEEVGRALLDALAGSKHIVFVHEAVFLTDEQRAVVASESGQDSLVSAESPLIDDEFFGVTKEEFFGTLPDEIRQRVNTLLRERGINVIPYRTNVERSVVATAFVEDNEHNLLFRVYVPSGRLYAQEAETLLGLFRDWLGQIGHTGIRQEGYTTTAGQVFEFFSAEGETGGLSRYFQDFSDFLESCVHSPEASISQLTVLGLEESAAVTVVRRYGTAARRLNLDLKQRREERVLSLKHQFENLLLETEGVDGDELEALLDELLPAPSAGSALLGPVGKTLPPQTAESSLPSITTINQQIFQQVSGAVIQNVQGTVNLGPEARDLMALIQEFGGNERGELEAAVHELEDEGARGADRIAARGRLKRFLADLGNRGMGIGLDILQKYLERKVGVS